ncbi:MAG: hypothetical protein HXY20_12440 [Acidobacteria bacterium]|nr:hypothetical protein [Acidobacteriota bacterium]
MNVKRYLAAVSTCAALILATGSIVASGQKKKGDVPPPASRAAGTSTSIAVDIFVGNDRDAIRKYYAVHPGKLPPGLAKRGGKLPPGLEKQLRRKGHLPPGLDKRIVAFPVELERRLARLKPGLARGVIEGRAVIYNPRTSVVMDVMLIL